MVHDLDGDGLEQTGWTILYMHVESRTESRPAHMYIRANPLVIHPVRVAFQAARICISPGGIMGSGSPRMAPYPLIWMAGSRRVMELYIMVSW